MKYSVVIPSYNSEETILKCLESLFAQDLHEPYEVIVVDSSQDSTPKLITEHYPQVKLISRDEKTDQGRARNIGVEAASGELIFFVDSDCLVPNGWMSTMIGWQGKGYEAVGGPVAVANIESSVAWAGYFMEFSNVLPGQEPLDVWHLPSGNVCYKRSFLEENPYPAGLDFALEDCLFHARLIEKGIKMISDPAIAVKHFQRDTLLSFMKHQFMLARGQCQMMRKVPMEGSYMVHHPWLVGVWALPFLPVVKFFRTSYYFYSWDRKLFFKKPLVLPCMAAGLLFWMFGMGLEMLTFFWKKESKTKKTN